MDNERNFRDPQKIFFTFVSFLIVMISLLFMAPLWQNMTSNKIEKKPVEIIDLKLPKVKKRSVTFRDV